MTAFAFETVEEATEASIQAATARLSPADAGAVLVLRGLAKACDYLLAHDGVNRSGRFDNVTIPTYLRYCEQLGLTPAGRKALAEKKAGAAGGKLAHLRQVSGAAAS